MAATDWHIMDAGDKAETIEGSRSVPNFSLDPGNKVTEELGRGQRPNVNNDSDTAWQLLDATHPSSFEDLVPHQDTFESFASDLMRAVEGGLVKPPRYSAVHVLLMSWGKVEAALEVGKETKRLERLFQKRFKFNTERFSIRSVQAQLSLERKLIEFREAHQDPSNLYILYYNGHGAYEDDTLWLLPKKSNCASDGVSLKWNPIQASLEAVPQDVLFIMDCCYAGAAAIRKGSGPIKELLAACGREAYTFAGQHSFSNCLIEALVDEKGPEVPISRLYASILGSKKALKRTPHHVRLSNHQQSIALPLPNRLLATRNANAVSQGYDINPAISTDSSPNSSDTNISSDNSQQNEVSSTPQISTGKTSPQTPKKYRALLAIKLNEDPQLDLTAWKNWLLNSPPEMVGLESIKLEAIHRTDSTLLVISMPVEIWTLLPSNPAYRFIDFVRSENLIKCKENPIDAVISLNSTRSGEYHLSVNCNHAMDYLVTALAHLSLPLRHVAELWTSRFKILWVLPIAATLVLIPMPTWNFCQYMSSAGQIDFYSSRTSIIYLSTRAIAGIAVGGPAILLGIILVLWRCWSSSGATDIVADQKGHSQHSAISAPTGEEGDEEEEEEEEEKRRTITKRHSHHSHTHVYTECGRHSDDWLFGGFSVTETVKIEKRQLLEAHRQQLEDERKFSVDQTWNKYMRTISLLGIFFLPGTFIVVSTTFFNSQAEPGHSVVSDRFWIYWAITLPVTLFVLAVWWVIERISVARREWDG